MAFFEQRKNGWRVQVRKRGVPSISRTFDLLADAQAWGREVEREVQRGNIAVLRNDAGRTMFREAAERFVAGPVQSMKSKRDVTRYIEIAQRRFGSIFLSSIRSVDVAAWRDELLASGLSSQTVIHHLNALSGCFGYIEKELSIALPAGNPVRGIRKPAPPKARERRLMPGELEALLKAATAPNAATGLPQIITLAVETSARLGELLSLHWKDVDLVERIATLHGSDGRETKNGEAFRVIGLSSKAIDALLSLPRNIDGKVFAWKTVSGFESIWQRCLARARRMALADETTTGKKQPSAFLADLRFHDLRHEATSRLFEKGLGIMEVASMTGHKSLTMLKRYTHVEARKIAAKLG